MLWCCRDMVLSRQHNDLTSHPQAVSQGGEKSSEDLCRRLNMVAQSKDHKPTKPGSDRGGSSTRVCQESPHMNQTDQAQKEHHGLTAGAQPHENTHHPFGPLMAPLFTKRLLNRAKRPKVAWLEGPVEGIGMKPWMHRPPRMHPNQITLTSCRT